MKHKFKANISLLAFKYLARLQVKSVSVEDKLKVSIWIDYLKSQISPITLFSLKIANKLIVFSFKIKRH